MWGDNPNDYSTYERLGRGLPTLPLPVLEILPCGCRVHVQWWQAVADEFARGCIATEIEQCARHQGADEIERIAKSTAEGLFERYRRNVIERSQSQSQAGRNNLS